MSRTRVLHIVQNLNYGGMERLIAEIARRLDPARFESHVLTLQYLGRFSQDVGMGVGTHEAPPMSRLSMLRPSALAGKIRELAPDVVHTHSGVWYKAALAARLARVPRIVHTEHGRKHPDPWQDRLIDRLAARNTDAVVAVSRPLAEHLVKRVLPRPLSLYVVPNGVDTALYRPRGDDGKLRAELGIAAQRPIIGSIGRLEPIKGYDVAVEAFADLLDHWDTPEPRPVLVLAGDGSERESLRRLATARGVADDIHFLGWRDDVETLHRAFTLFTMSSRSEGTSVSLLEAMSAGLCPVVTDVGGNREVLGEALAARLVPSGSRNALAAAWHQALVDHPEQLRLDAQRARARVLEAFDVTAMVRGYEKLYLDASGDVRPPLRLVVASQATA